MLKYFFFSDNFLHMVTTVLSIILSNIFTIGISVAVIIIFAGMFLKHKALNNPDNIRTTTAQITKLTNTTYNFCVHLYKYEYSFQVGNVTYTGKYVQNSPDYKKNGQLSSTQKVIYVIDDPSKNRLEIDNQMADNRKIIIAAVLVVLFLMFIF